MSGGRQSKNKYVSSSSSGKVIDIAKQLRWVHVINKPKTNDSGQSGVAKASAPKRVNSTAYIRMYAVLIQQRGTLWAGS